MDEYPIIDLSHLLPAARAWPVFRRTERIQRLRADRWIGYPRAVEALNRLEALYVAKQATHAQPAAGWPDQQWQVDDRREVPPPHPPGPAPTPTRIHPGVGRADAVRAVRDPLLRRAARRDGRRCAHAHGCRKWSNWLWHCCAVGVRMLVIDELHNVLAGNSVNRREFLSPLRFLGNELRIPLVGVGTRDAYLAIRPMTSWKIASSR